jgi:DNA-binding CsgD family transcriptional regulator
MAKSDLLRVQDVRDAYRLIGECRDLGYDPALWHQRMLEGVSELIGVPHAAGGEGWWRRPKGPVQQISVFESSKDHAFREGLKAYVRSNAIAACPIWDALLHVSGPLLTRTRRQLVRDEVWYRSLTYEYERLAAVDHVVVSVNQVTEAGGISVICLYRAEGERDFSPREQRVLNFFHGELGRLIGRSLVSTTERTGDQLSPRLRQTLSCLLEGDSEKQVASRLGLSQATTHEYVTALYRHFGVQSRAQLMAHAIKRLAQGEQSELYARR